MTTLTWPTLSVAAPESFTFTLASNTMHFQSPLSGAMQTVEFPGARWKASFTLDSLAESDAALLRAFGAKLRGRAGRFYLHHMANPNLRGTVTGSPSVNGGGQTGNTLALASCGAGKTILAGDFIGVNGELKMVVANATADGGGYMTVTIEPPLRSSPTNGSTVTTVKPTATFMLSEDSWRDLVKAPYIATFVVDAVEVWA